MGEDYMKYDGNVPEPPYTTTSDLMDRIAELESELALCAAGPYCKDLLKCPLGVDVLMLGGDGRPYVAVWSAPPIFDRDRHPNAPVAFSTLDPSAYPPHD